MPTSTGPIKNSFADRRLAAIVFTDVAGFSRLVEQSERHTLQLVQRDLKLIGEVFRKFGGDVLKNTGDGCLATFPSVEGAVGSALRIQRIIADARHRLPPEEILHHRIGIHLGDVFLSQGDVLGNGVNIAARLLGEAEPDGICVSQTVYDLVKHRLDVKAVSIGARELKNIREAMQVYRLVLEAAADELGEAATANRSRRRALTITSASLLILAIIGIGVWSIVRLVKSDTKDSIAPTDLSAASTGAGSATGPAIIKGPTGLASPKPLSTFAVPQQKPTYLIDSATSWRAFPILSRELLSTSVESNQYVMTVHGDQSHILVAVTPWGAMEDLTFQAVGRIRGAPLGSWGLQLFSVQGDRKLARVMIGANGVLRVDLSRVNGANSSNQGMNPADNFTFPATSIRRSNEPNTLLLIVRNHKLSVLVNDQRFGTTWDITPLGPVTAQLAVEGHQGVVARFDQLQVWLPNSGIDRDLAPTVSPTTQ